MKHIGIFILFFLCLTLLLLSGNLEIQGNTEEPVMWSGLGMGLLGVENITQFNADLDTLLANGFTKIRVHLSPYNQPGWQTMSKAGVLSAVSKGADVIWGITGGAGPTTAANWPNYRQAILEAAQWAQDNGVYEFQLGNEEEMHNDDTTLTDAQLIANLKSVATEVQAIFTNGKISYSCAGVGMDTWIATGKGDIDILATNLYMGGDDSPYDNYWKSMVDKLVNAFGGDGIYFTEFAPSWSALDDYSTDEAVQAQAVKEMIDYIKASGIERASYFCYRDPIFGVVKEDGTYRQLWSQALLNTGNTKFDATPTKTTTKCHY